MHYRSLWLILGLIYIAVILAGSLLRVSDVNIHFNATDKIIHFLIYFILVAWYVQLYQQSDRRLLVLLGAIVLGLCIEYLQAMTTYRSFDYVDEIANSIGAICAFLLVNTSSNSMLSRLDLWLYRLKNK